MAVNIHQGCSLEAMKSMKDNQYDLAVVDPPYGIKQAKGISYGNWARDIHTEKDWDNSIPPRNTLTSCSGCQHIRLFGVGTILFNI